MHNDINAKNKGSPLGLHVVAKPIGPLCNLNREYCFYLEKKALLEARETYRMSDEVVSSFITNYIKSQPTPVVELVWQGGEPALLGIDFFKRAIELQRPFTRQKTITNSLQTNGSLLTDEWCDFLKKYDFMVGISLDGPKEIHNRYRHDHQGNGTFDLVIRGLRLLQKHHVEYNVLACVARDHCVYPQYNLGNISNGSLFRMVSKSVQSGFGVMKESALPRWCRECEVLAACQGGCPKHHFTQTYDNKPGLHYLCAGYKKFFLHIRKYLRVMAKLLENRLPASCVMKAVKGPLVIKDSNER